jgi:hypothetical protein
MVWDPLSQLNARARIWGVTTAEAEQRLPCDRYLADADHVYWRAVEVRAPVAKVYRWLCQLRIAPYSYDWIDNFGRTSPRQLVPGVEDIAAGQPVMTIFRVAEQERDSHITIVLAAPRARAMFGDIAITYAVTPMAGGTRLAAKVLVRYPRRGLWRCMRALLPWGDLIMMRKQLRTLKALAERHGSPALEEDVHP